MKAREEAHEIPPLRFPALWDGVFVDAAASTPTSHRSFAKGSSKPGRDPLGLVAPEAAPSPHQLQAGG